MSLSQEAASWLSPPPVQLSPAPQAGDKAPSCPELPLPANNNRPTIISFLRHCGCPVAEATFLELRTAAENHSEINFVAVSRHFVEPCPESSWTFIYREARLGKGDLEQAYREW
ncbi:hypothetical protein CBS76997_5486 [Aspergillus niger]|nr:hypothetical protein CBS13152_7348 [Aspergillus niger]KAI3043779.1 hypothetical protein CBS76997_5486 [Aspergillus niger]